MKKTLLFITALFCVSFLYAQNNTNNIPLTNEDFFNQAELVFEGFFINCAATYDTKGNGKREDILAIVAYKVQRVYKGDLSLAGSIIYTIEKGYGLGAENTVMKITEPQYVMSMFLWNNGVRDVSPWARRILFFTASDFSENGAPEKYSSYKKYKPLENKYAEDLYVSADKIIGLDSLIFPNRETFHNYIRQFEGFIVPTSDPVQEKQPEEIELNNTVIDTTSLEYFKVPFQKEMNKDNKKKDRKKKQKNKAYNTLTLQVGNQKFVYDYNTQNHYVEFDILVSSNNPNIYLNDTYMEVKYNSAIFGTCVFFNNKIIVNKGELFNNANDYQFYYFNDFSNNEFCFTFAANRTSPPTRVTLSDIPVPLLHFKMELLPNISLSQSVFSLKQSLSFTPYTYTLTSNIPNYPGNYYYYDQYFFINSDTIPISTAPCITNLSPISRVAGIGDVLTIEGNNFRGTQGKVLFTAANRGGTFNNNPDFLCTLDQQYYLSNGWSNTEIKVIVPSEVTQGLKNTDTTFVSGVAGTGHIKIITANGDTCMSENHILQVPYSALNARAVSGGLVRRVYLAKTDCNYDFMFTLHKDYKNDNDKIRAIDTALKRWSRLTGLTLVLKKGVDGKPIFDSVIDNTKNLILPIGYYTNSLTNAVMLTNVNCSWFILNIADTVVYIKAGSHIYIRDYPSSTTSWNYEFSGTLGSTERSFYQAFMHELGHILLLDHVNDSHDLMYWSIQGAHPNIIDINSNSNPVKGVKDNIEARKSIPWPAGFVKTPKITIVGHSSPLFCNFRGKVTLSSNYTTGNLWLPGGETTQTIQVVPDGTYWLKNTEDNCGITDTVSLTLSTLNASCNVTPVKCFEENNGSIITNADGLHQPFTYHWTGNGIDTYTQNLYNLTAGTYYLTLSNSAGCIQNYTVPVTQPEELFVYFSQTPTTYDATVVGGPPYEYYWSYKFAALYQCPRVLFTMLPSVPISYEQPPCYLQLTVIDANGCQITGSPAKNQMMPKSITQTTMKEITLYPNPTMGSFSISNITDATLYLYSTLGSHIKTFEHVSNNETINISNLSNGIYFLKIIDGNTIKNEKLILSK